MRYLISTLISSLQFSLVALGHRLIERYPLHHKFNPNYSNLKYSRSCISHYCPNESCLNVIFHSSTYKGQKKKTDLLNVLALKNENWLRKESSTRQSIHKTHLAPKNYTKLKSLGLPQSYTVVL
jgi:hypothetical protein